jgi:hypothetical protein
MDTLGLIFAVVVTAAHVDDREGLVALLNSYFADGVTRLRKLWVDGGVPRGMAVRLAGDPEPKALRFNRALLYDCGAGRYARQQQATTFIRRTLKKMGILSS